MNVALTENPGLPDIAAIAEEALAVEREGFPELAYEAWNRLTARFAENPAALIKAADDLRLENPPVAEALLGHLVRTHPGNLIAALKWVEIALKRADWTETARRGVIARRRFPDSSFGYVLPALALRESGKLAEADAALSEACERFPADEGAAIHWADCAMRRSDPEEALRRYAVARERFPKSPFGYTNSLQVLRASGQNERAEAMLEEAVEKFPDNLDLHYEWTAGASNRGDWPEALRRAKISQERFPDTPRGVLPAFQALTAMGRTEEADALIQEAADRFPNDPTILHRWVDAAVKAQNWPEARVRAAQLCARFPDDDTGHFFTAVALREERRPEEAIAFVEEALKRFPDDASLLREASESLIQLQRLDEAAAMLDRALQHRPREAPYLHRRIQLAMNLKDYNGAMTVWRRLKADRQMDPKLSLELAWTMLKACPADENAAELIAYLINEKDTGGRNWLPHLAGLILQRLVRPDLADFAKSLLPELEAGPHEAVTLELLKSALFIDYSDDDIRSFIRDYVAGGRSAITAHLFSQTYTHEKPKMADTFRTLFAEHMDRWLDEATPAHFQNFTEVLGYLNFAAIFSQPHYHRLIEGCQQHVEIGKLRADESLRTPASVIGRIIGERARNLAKVGVIDSKRRLKIAICVSGQLRGYEKAFPTWDHMRLGRHEVRYFIHTWRDIGRNWYRFWTFTKTRELLWEVLQRPDSTTALAARYPKMTLACTGESIRTREQLQEFYNTPHVVVEDDAQPPFSDKNTPWKMHSKIERAHQMAHDSGEEFDLYIRISPTARRWRNRSPTGRRSMSSRSAST